ncbi:MAG: type I-C CRISPR-associated protein Cas8c/Csd1 [Desulfobulbaceae bacterium]|nr:type I-C CRISPR-associated protein Cas8c/Csd1 [Desulfobulbaceae bacterium]
MILQALAGYYQRMAEAGGTEVAPEGFEKKGIPFVIVVNVAGNFVGIDDTREGEGKKKEARAFTVPKGVKKTSGVAANLLWDTPAYVVGRAKPDTKKDALKQQERAKEQFQCFVAKIKETFPESYWDEGVTAVLQFLEANYFDALFSHSSWQEIEDGGANLTFRLDTDNNLVCQRPAVVKRLTSGVQGVELNDNQQMCLISGEFDEATRLHTAIKGVWGAQSSGANIVSFNLDAFRSFGKDQGLNAPVGKRAEFAYTTALNTLLAKGARQRLQVGDASTVFWAEKKNEIEDVFADFFGEPAKENPEQATKAIRILYESPKAGVTPLTEDDTRFHVLGLAPNAARIAIRFWHTGTVGEMALHIRQHFDDCAMAHGPKQPEYLSLFRLLVSTALQGKSENIPPNLAGDFMRSILLGSPYPQTILAAAIRRCRAEREITYPRAALIKAVLARAARLSQHQEKEVGMALDTDNINIGYRLGRLFATLEKIQEEASPGLNATIRDRFYGAASGTPVTAFPHLMKLKNHHLAKLDSRGRAVNLEKLIGEIIGGVTDFPSHLSLQDQGRFAVGYYHQRQAFFTKSEAH